MAVDEIVLDFIYLLPASKEGRAGVREDSEDKLFCAKAWHQPCCVVRFWAKDIFVLLFIMPSS